MLKNPEKNKFENKVYTGDNLYILNGMNSESVDLIYLDPPFNSKRVYEAPIGSKAEGASFKDIWTWNDIDETYLENMIDKYPSLFYFIKSIDGLHSKAMMSYILYMCQRLIELHRILKSTGSIYLHCDPTASHYLKILLDKIFGKGNFKNEIVWCYKENETATKYFPRKHDVVLFYSKSDNTVFNIQRGDYTEAQLKRYNHVDENGDRWANMKGKMRKLTGGAKLRDWWPIQIVQKKERTGYPTQKPLALLHRIIKASTDEGDIVLDPFCGCATTCVAAQQLNRKWIGIDISEKSVELVAERLKDNSGLFSSFITINKIPKRTDKEIIKIDYKLKRKLYGEQEGNCNGCKIHLDIKLFEIDHIIPKSKGGGDYKDNFQLLCGHCNKMKSNKPMEYLKHMIQKRKEIINRTVSFVL